MDNAKRRVEDKIYVYFPSAGNPRVDTATILKVAKNGWITVVLTSGNVMRFSQLGKAIGYGGYYQPSIIDKDQYERLLPGLETKVALRQVRIQQNAVYNCETGDLDKLGREVAILVGLIEEAKYRTSSK